ncbi:1-phosphofructokinase [Treponema sp. J25]|uniref:1-phosphofructokinase n=1 Tax=Treponema sp. J25 TaxID=2094121 RepID=UPI0010490546|nr:1-phosphofructokinase [Treponema sp. J25]TCW60926.1 1-phosphofructokinase [Treponema sp. J25]
MSRSIRTLTLNPAVDRTVLIEDFSVNQVNRIQASRLDAGGKGINVSKSIHAFGGASCAYGVAAGSAGRFIASYLTDLGIEHQFVWVDGETRTNIKIVDPRNRTHTDINDQGPELTGAALAELESLLFAGADRETILVFSGSIGRGTPADIYKKWIQKARSIGYRTILDADGEALRLGIEAGPTLVKPNIHELERLVGRPFQEPAAQALHDIAAAALRLLDSGTETVVVSLGAEGALFVNRQEALYAKGLPVEAKSTVGAGDAMVAALAMSLERHAPLERHEALDQHMPLSAMVAAAIGAGAAAVAAEGTASPSRADLEHYASQVTYISL